MNLTKEEKFLAFIGLATIIITIEVLLILAKLI